MVLIIQYMLIYAAVFSLVAFGGMFSERSGIINIGLEGIMVIGAISGTVSLTLLTQTTNPETMSAGKVAFLTFVQETKFLLIIIPVLVSAVAGGIYSLLLAFATINLKADQTIGGTALNVLATSIAIIIARMVNTNLNGSQSPKLSFDKTAYIIPIHLGNKTLELNWFFIITLIILGLAVFVLYYTKFGLRMRSCGEHPQASASMGINVFKMRYAGVLISGILGGIGGIAYIFPAVSSWTFDVGVAGAGFLALSVMIFGQWKPVKIFLAALFFGLFRAAGDVSDTVFSSLYELGFNSYVFKMLPFIFSLIVLVFTSKKSRAPKAEGQPYEKGMR